MDSLLLMVEWLAVVGVVVSVTVTVSAALWLVLTLLHWVFPTSRPAH